MVAHLEIDAQFWDDQDWALQHYAELTTKHSNQWVAVYNQQVVASGPAPEQVRTQAADKTGRARENIVVIFAEAGDQIF